MRVAIMQPYLFPYLGYFQLLRCADVFVLLDDVQFIKKGWINRNRLLVKQAAHLFTIPLVGSSQNVLIRDLRLLPGHRAQHKLLATIAHEYRAAPELERVQPLVAQVLLSPEPDLTTLVGDSLRRILAHVGLAVPIVRSSEIVKDPLATGQERILAICEALRADEYVNMQGGAALYSAADFAARGLALRLLAPVLTPYPQGGAAFVPGLSIIDVLMHSSPARAREFFEQGELR